MKAVRLTGQFIVIAALFAGVAALSDWPTWSQIPKNAGVVMLTFVHGADRRGECRRLTPEEIVELVEAVNRHARALTLPTLLLWGERDGIVSRDATTRTLIAIPGAANLEVLHGVGHSPMLEAPLALAERIISFVAEDFAGYDEIRGRVGG